MSNFPLVPLSKVATVRSGYAFKSSDWKTSGVPVIKIANIHPGTVELAGCAYVDESVADAASGYRALKGDPLIAMSGASVGEIGRVRFAESALVNQRVGIFRVQDDTQLDADFLYHFLQQPETIDFFVSAAYGSAQPNISPSLILGVEIPLPTLVEQQAIAEVLNALDDKIAANTQIISKTDELSHTVFRSMVRTESQLIPLSNTANFVNGKAFTKGASGTGRVVIRIAELNSGIGPSTVYNDIEVSDQHVAHAGDLLFAWTGSLTLHRWFRPAGIVNQHIFKVIPNENFPQWLVYELLRHKLEEFKAIAADKATTMGHIQRKHLDQPVAVPAAETIRKHNELMKGLWDKALWAEVENLKLAEARDALLPQLMSGQLRVRDAEKILENAGV